MIFMVCTICGGKQIMSMVYCFCCSHCWGNLVLGLCFFFFFLQYIVSFLVLQSSGRERESWLLYFCCVLLSFFDPSSRFRELV